MYISFILPVLNVEKYIEKCIESLLPVENSEIILVIGNSSDKSNEICYKYSEKYEKISVVIRNSTGLSNGRNCGYAVCNGEYVAFIDSDDYVNTENLIKNIQKIKKTENIDVLVTDYIKDYGDETFESTNQIKSDFIGYEYTKEFLKSKGFYFSVWRNIYKRSFLLENDFTFMEGKICEDVPYTTKVFAVTKNIYFTNLEHYHYRTKREGSLMNTFSIKRIRDTIDVFELGISNLENSSLKYKKSFVNKILLSYFYTISEIYLHDEFNEECYNEFKKSLKILLKTKEFTMVYIIIKVIGLKQVAKMLNFAKKRKNVR